MNIRSRNRIGILAVGLVVLIGRPETAMADPPSDVQAMLAAMFGYAMPTHPLKRGQKELKIVPSYVLGDDPVSQPPGGSVDPRLLRNEELSGFGWAGSFVWGFSEHLGLSVLGAGIRESGTIDSSSGLLGRNSYRGGKQEGRGYAGAVSLIYDPFKGDGFRLPLLLGLSITSFSSEISATNSGGEGIEEEGSNEGPGLLLGLAPQFDLWKIRAAPFVIASVLSYKGKGSRTEYPPTGGPVELQRDITSDTVGVVGVDLTYRPWGLGFTYIPDFSGVTAYTLKWAKKWGGEAAD